MDAPVYKIRCTETGLFSKGGTGCDKTMRKWSRFGKVWSTRGHVVSHLRQYSNTPRNWEILEISIDALGGNSVVKRTPASEFMASADDRKAVRDNAKKKRFLQKEKSALLDRIKQIDLKIKDLK